MNQANEQHTIPEIAEALSVLDEDSQQLVLGVLAQQTELRRIQKQEQAHIQSICDFTAAYERATAPHANTSNIEGWFETIDDEAEAILNRLAHKENISDTEQLAKKAAAMAYVGLTAEAEGDECVDQDLLINAGIPIESFRTEFTEAVIGRELSRGTEREELEKGIGNIREAYGAETFELFARYWRHIARPTITELRSKLNEAGHTLPVLDKRGRYPEEYEGWGEEDFAEDESDVDSGS